MKNYKLIQFDLKRAKTPENPNGLEVVTKGGKDVRIICTDKKGMPIVALISYDGSMEDCNCYDNDGKSWGATEEFLCLKEPIKSRKMTHQELSWWLRDSPEEHREYVYFSVYDKYEERRIINCVYTYSQEKKDKPVEGILIRSNGGEWREPYITEEE